MINAGNHLAFDPGLSDPLRDIRRWHKPNNTQSKKELGNVYKLHYN